jgi:hypothetical protein
MKYFLLALLLTLSTAGYAQPQYTGYLLTSQSCTQNYEPYWQCAGLWKPAAEVLDSDFVSACATMNSFGECAVRTRWKLKTTLTDSSYVQTCDGLPATPTNKTGCGGALSQWFYQLVPTPLVAPVCTLNVLCFYNVITVVTPEATEVPFHFWAGLPDVNNDGCRDIFIGKHEDGTDSSMSIQDNVNDLCAGTFTYVPEADSGYTQGYGERCTGRYIFGDWYGHPEGLWSFYCHDVDAPPSARYVAMEVIDGIPQYAPKDIGCYGRVCLPADITGDGVIEMVTREQSTDNLKMAVLKNTETGAVELSPGPTPYGPLAIFDVNNDTWPEILHPTARGYLSYVAGALVWNADKFPTGGLPALAGAGHSVPLDYDNDGDEDFYFGAATYDCATCSPSVTSAIKGTNTFYVRMYENDGNGNFTDVTTAAGLTPGLLKNKYIWTGYANTVAVDIDNDGDRDLVMAGESEGHSATASTVTIIRNNGNKTFTIDRSINFGVYKSDTNTAARPWVNVGDYDNDCKVDIIKPAGESGPNHSGVTLWRNVIVNNNHCVKIRVQGATSMGLHSRIVIKDPSTGAIVTGGQVSAFTEGYQDLLPHFGVGERALIDIEVHMPHGGPVCAFEDAAVDKEYIVRDCELLEYTPGTQPGTAGNPPPPPDPTYTETETSRQYYLTVETSNVTEYPTRAAAVQAAHDILDDENNTATVGIDEVIHSSVEVE